MDRNKKKNTITMLFLLYALCLVDVVFSVDAAELGAPVLALQLQQEMEGDNDVVEIDEMYSTGGRGDRPFPSSSEKSYESETTAATEYDHDGGRALNKKKRSSCIQRRRCEAQMDQVKSSCIFQRLCDLKKKNPTKKARKDCRVECIQEGRMEWKRCAKPCRITPKVNKKTKPREQCLKKRKCNKKRNKAKVACIKERGCRSKSTRDRKKQCVENCAADKGANAYKKCSGGCTTQNAATTTKDKSSKVSVKNKKKKACMKKRKCNKKRNKAKLACIKERGCRSKSTRDRRKQCEENCAADKGTNAYKKCSRGCTTPDASAEKKPSKISKRRKACLKKRKCNTKRNSSKAACIEKRGCNSKPTRAKKKQCKESCSKKGENTYKRCAEQCKKNKNEKPKTSLEWDNNNAATIEFCQEGNRTFGYRLPGTTYCGPAGLVIRVNPGEDYQLTVRNVANETTNVHAHGLHISGDGNANDVTRVIDPDMCLTYHWNIPEDHMGGTHWIHSNLIGSARDQVAGGAFAMLIVEEDRSTLLENVGDNDDKENIEAWLDNELLLVAHMYGSAFTSNGNTDNITTLDIIAGEWYRLRLVTVQDDGGRVPVSIASNSTECDGHVVAWDGVWRFGGPNTNIERSIQPSGSGRVDLAIRCITSGQYHVTAGDNADRVAALNVVSGTTTRANPFLNEGGSWEPGRPNYLRDLANGNFSSLNNTLFNHSMIELSGGGSGGSPLMINYQQWNETTAIGTLEYDSLQKWLIYGSDTHPFHLHTYHVQTYNCDGHDDLQYYDSVTSSNNDCMVLFHVIDYSGRTVAQSQNLGQLDEGMMVWFDVQGAPIQSTLDRDQKTC